MAEYSGNTLKASAAGDKYHGNIRAFNSQSECLTFSWICASILPVLIKIPAVAIKVFKHNYGSILLFTWLLTKSHAL